MKSNPFWQSTRILLEQKFLLVVALVGALVSAACFGVGVGMLVPIFNLLLKDKRTLAELAQRYVDGLTGPGASQWQQTCGQWLSPWVGYVPKDALEGFVVVLAVVAVLALVGSVARYVHEYVVITVCGRASMSWRKRLFHRLIHAPLPELIQRGTTDHVSRMMVDASALGNGYQTILGRTVADVTKGVAALGVAFVLNWRLAMGTLVVAPLLAVLLRKFGKKVRRAAHAALSERGRLLGTLKEVSGGISVVKVHTAEGYERRRFNRMNRVLFGQEMKARQAKAISSPVIETITLYAVMGVAIVAAWLIFRRGWDPTEFMGVLVALALAGASMRTVTNLSTQLRETEAAAGRVLEALALPVEPCGLDAPQDRPAMPRHRGRIVFEKVSYRYPGATRWAVEEVSLEVGFGQTVAVVGGNGAGKSSLLNLLPRLSEPTTGRVLVDGNDIAHVSLRSLRSQMAMVTQQTILFRATVAENIAYGRRYERREKVIEAAKAAYADDFVGILPKGYDTLLGEDGSGLSGGQRQRLCIARAVLRDPAILILDEATSQIDADSEAKINQALRHLRHGRTTFIIAHRLSTVVDADLIVVMDQGRIVDQGTHFQLLERCGIYQQLTQTQLMPASR